MPDHSSQSRSRLNLDSLTHIYWLLVTGYCLLILLLLIGCGALPPRRQIPAPPVDPTQPAFQRQASGRYHEVDIGPVDHEEQTKLYLAQRGRQCIFYGALAAGLGIIIALAVQQPFAQQLGAAIGFSGFGAVAIGVFLTKLGEWWTWLSIILAAVIIVAIIVLYRDRGVDAWIKSKRKPPA